MPPSSGEKREAAEAVIANVGRRIAELRRERDMTQQELAEALSVTRQYITRVEGGYENLSIGNLVYFAEALGAEIGDLFTKAADVPRRPGRPPKKAH